MERAAGMKQRDVLKALIIIYAIGFLGHLVLPIRGVMNLLTPPVLLITGILALRFTIKPLQKRFVAWFIVTFSITFAVEAIGVQTGKIFGVYQYSDILGPRVAGVPLIIGFNWAVVIYCSIRFAQCLVKNKIGSSLLASGFTVAYDGVLEPVAFRLEYWYWQTGDVPIQNYPAWWGLSLFCIILYHLFKVHSDDRIPAFYYVIQFTYFLLLFISLRMLAFVF